MIAIKILWGVFVFIIFEAMVGYPLSLLALDKLYGRRKHKKQQDAEPTVAIMVVAHNEEKVIGEKLENLMQLDYPADKLEIIVASDFSTDQTNQIVEDFIAAHPDRKILLHKSVKHMGKTNAQNEAQEKCTSEILIMTDANAMLDKRTVRELTASFADENVAYVTGQLKYVNTGDSKTADSEGFYWKLDLMCRRIESDIQTITAGNGAIYAVRNRDYVKIAPIECHDSSFPVLYALQKKRALYNPEAVAYEKAGEVDQDEFKRKVRMNRRILEEILPSPKILNVFAYRWFSYFYFGHRTCRYLLWLAHLMALVLNIPLAFTGLFWQVTLALQVLFYLIAILGWITKAGSRLVRIITYYCMTVLAQWKGVFNIVTGRVKPVWEKAESTR
ncbi:MAG: glycosyltransferase family 2 protein [Clostridia bacterium]|nr:glycosyltransferase family 2 protein [Clostridia bacterium]